MEENPTDISGVATDYSEMLQLPYPLKERKIETEMQEIRNKL